MITVADLEQFDDDAMIVFRADTERELNDDLSLSSMGERLSFEPVSVAVADDVDYWEPDTDRIRMKALVWKNVR